MLERVKNAQVKIPKRELQDREIIGHYKRSPSAESQPVKDDLQGTNRLGN